MREQPKRFRSLFLSIPTYLSISHVLAAASKLRRPSSEPRMSYSARPGADRVGEQTFTAFLDRPPVPKPGRDGAWTPEQAVAMFRTPPETPTQGRRGGRAGGATTSTSTRPTRWQDSCLRPPSCRKGPVSDKFDSRIPRPAFDTYDSAVAQAMVSSMPLTRIPEYLGIRVTDVGPGTMTAELEVRPELLNPFGSAHGGVLAALMDHVSRCCALPAHPARSVGSDD